MSTSQLAKDVYELIDSIQCARSMLADKYPDVKQAIEYLDQIPEWAKETLYLVDIEQKISSSIS